MRERSQPRRATSNVAASIGRIMAMREVMRVCAGVPARTRRDPLREWKAAMRLVRKMQHKNYTAPGPVSVREQSNTGRAFDGKEIREKGGRLIGYWRFRAGHFEADYLLP